MVFVAELFLRHGLPSEVRRPQDLHGCNFLDLLLVFLAQAVVSVRVIDPLHLYLVQNSLEELD